jgi:hypothetical protein
MSDSGPLPATQVQVPAVRAARPAWTKEQTKWTLVGIAIAIVVALAIVLPLVLVKPTRCVVGSAQDVIQRKPGAQSVDAWRVSTACCGSSRSGPCSVIGQPGCAPGPEGALPEYCWLPPKLGVPFATAEGASAAGEDKVWSCDYYCNGPAQENAFKKSVYAQQPAAATVVGAVNVGPNTPTGNLNFCTCALSETTAWNTVPETFVEKKP